MPRTRALALLAAPAAVFTLSASSCEPVDNCSGLPAPDAGLTAAAVAHPEVEFETEGRNDAECILVIDEQTGPGGIPPVGRWTDLTDEEA